MCHTDIKAFERRLGYPVTVIQTAQNHLITIERCITKAHKFEGDLCLKLNELSLLSDESSYNFLVTLLLVKQWHYKSTLLILQLVYKLKNINLLFMQVVLTL